MPFHKRTIEPPNLCRFNKGAVESEAEPSQSQLWTSLNEVSCTSLKNILQQLSGLSRHACSIFLEIQSEAAVVIQRSTALQRRLDTLQHIVRELDHRKIRIHCISQEPTGKCWNRTYYEDEDKLLSFYIHKPQQLHSNNGGSLHCRLLNFNIHQKQDQLRYSRQWNSGLTEYKSTQTQHSNTFIPIQKDLTAVSSLDDESKWSVHYTAPWQQQENVFLPGSRPPCVEELHCQAKVNLKTVLRECDKLRKDGFRSSQYYSQGPTFSSPLLSDEDRQLDRDEITNKKKSSETSSEEEKLVYSFRTQTPHLDNISDINNHNSYCECLPLPTPEEKMRQQALFVTTDIVPINITGENFDRQASFRRTTINTDTIIRRSKRVKRRKTITGVPDNIKRELANNEQTKTQSIKGQYSNLGDEGSINSSLQHLLTRESGCQINDIKIAPSSVRKICLQKDSGITTQFANTSLSSPGSNYNMNDCNRDIYTYQFNSSDQGFHSLPRQNSQICQFETICTSSPYLSASGSTSSLPYKVPMQHASLDSAHKSDLRKIPTASSGFDKVCGFQNQNECHTGTSSCMALNLHSSISSLNAGIVLQNARNSSVHASQSVGSEETPIHSLPTCPSDHPFSSSGTLCSTSSSGRQSQASLHVATETGSQSEIGSPLSSNVIPLNSSPCGVCEDSDMSESSIYSCSTLTINNWTHKHGPVDQWTSSCSSPTAGNSLELSPSKTDISSLFSVDIEECSTSMHLSSSHKSYSHSCINEAGNTRHNLYKCKEDQSPDDCDSLLRNHSLSRSISLRKSKKPPLPPKRTDSLQRKPQRKPCHNEKLPNEQQTLCRHESLKSYNASYSGQIPFSRLENTWKLCPRSQSSVSVESSGMSAPADVCPTTPTYSDSSSQHSEYSWDFHTDNPQSFSEYGPSPQMRRAVHSKENSRGLNNNEISLAACLNSEVNFKMAASPDKVHFMTSPSSGYSSQSITPTAGTPVTVLRTKLPAGRPKPKVPERKSSLRSSVTFHSSPLFSITSDLVKSLPTPLPLPKTLPGLVTSQSTLTSPLPGLPTSTVSPVTPSPPAISFNSKEKQVYPVSSTMPEQYLEPILFPPDTSHATLEPSSSLMLVENKMSSPPLPPPPPLPPLSNVLQDVTNSPNSLDQVKKLDCNLAIQERSIITAQALQRVKLRPIKLIKLENIFTDIITTVCDPDNQEQKTKKPVETEFVKQVITSDYASPLESDVNTTDFLSKESTSTMLVSSPASVLIDPASKTHSSDSLELSPDTGPLCTPAHTDFLQSTATLFTSNDTLQDCQSNRDLDLHQTSLNELEDTDSAMSTKSENINSMSPIYTVIQHELEVESDSHNSTPTSPRRHSVSSEMSSDSLAETQLNSTSGQDIGVCDPDLGLSDKDPVLSDEKCITDDSLSSSSGSVIFKEEENDENDALFDSGTDSSSPTFSNSENIEEMSPARPRTIDDLFAAIHRSKRKVLGRCDFEKERPCTFITSPPISPTSFSPSLNLKPHQSSNISRSQHRSTTNNDSFKALLLKKGSRSDPGFRMSAMEILKCTDPRLQRSSAEPSSPFSAQCTSPGRSRKAYEQWARTEGALPHLSPSLTHCKYGRASTPPCSASSRYNSRSRIPSGPMTVICEREGELAESLDCCNIPFPLSLSSSATLGAQGST
ncbi:NHS-like protein 1 [Bagarius yarrelli]|uniref:NHS-like protein 1 n=1 Tax=Bagarius yarrelli TaxID=175774 RepID=A0A556U8D8_BAGYA|nr:NHS-like protein 1 [Bagarius yarrelli]